MEHLQLSTEEWKIRFLAHLLSAISDEMRNTHVLIASKIDYGVRPQDLLPGQLGSPWDIKPREFGVKTNVPVFLFKPAYPVDASGLWREYEKRALIVDPYAQVAICQEYPEFTRQHRNMTHWSLTEHGCSFAQFQGGKISCGWMTGASFEDWWHVGVPKASGF